MSAGISFCRCSRAVALSSIGIGRAVVYKTALQGQRCDVRKTAATVICVERLVSGPGVIGWHPRMNRLCSFSPTGWRGAALDYNDFDTSGPHIARVSFSILAFRQKLHS